MKAKAGAARAAILLLLCALLPAAAGAASWQTRQPAVMYDAPSAQARPLLILTGGFPLKEVSRVHGWHKVSGHSGDIGWVEASALAAARAAVVLSDRAAVRADPHPAAPAVFFAKRGVVLEVLQPAAGGGWMKVLHKDGEIGYLQQSDSWRNF